MQQQNRDSDELLLVPGLLMPEVTAYFRVASALLMAVLGWFSVTLEVFIRHSFGERYLSLIRVFLAWQALGLAGLAMFMVFQGNVNAGIDPIALAMITPVFLAAAILQLIWIQIRNWRKVPWHSRSFGLSWLHPLVWRWDRLFYRLIEPAFCFVVGLVVMQVEKIAPVGGWICFAAVALLVKNNIAFNIERDYALDKADAAIEAAYMREAEEGRDKAKTGGFSVVRISRNIPQPVAPMNTAKTVSEAMKHADLMPTGSGD